MLNDRDWQFKYTPEDGDLVRVFYVPALQDAQRYDRLTGYFDAGALALAARGVEGLSATMGVCASSSVARATGRRSTRFVRVRRCATGSSAASLNCR